MNVLKLITFSIIIASIGLIFEGTISAQEEKEEKTVTIADILKKAECPLTEEQEKKLKEFKLGGDPEAFRTMYDVFNEKQMEALKKALGTFPGFQGGPETPRFLFFAIIFENEGQPFTESQLVKIKNLPEGPEAFEEMQNIFTTEQSEIMQNMFNR